jgi:Tat protein translocase TatB subunit
MFSLTHWLVIGVVALVVLGPERLPTAARQASRWLRRLADAREAFEDSVREEDPRSSEQDGARPE